MIIESKDKTRQAAIRSYEYGEKISKLDRRIERLRRKRSRLEQEWYELLDFTTHIDTIYHGTIEALTKRTEDPE